MPHPTFSGKEIEITFDSVVARFKSIAVEIMHDDRIINPSDTYTIRRAGGTVDAKVTIVGYESDDSGAGNFALVAGMALANTAPSAIAWNGDDDSPGTRLPADFFTEWFPLSEWRVRNPKGGSGGPTDTAEWSVDLLPGFDD